jgi:hypothetical protein
MRCWKSCGGDERIVERMMWTALGLGLVMLLGRGQEPAATSPAAPATVEETDRPLPVIDELLRDVEKNEKAAEKLRADYTYHVHIAQEDVDGKGGVKKTTVTDSESLTVAGVRVNRVVARDGKPLTPEETKKESDKIDKEVEKDKERRAKLEDEGKATDSRGDEVITVARILELGKFSNARRVEMEGRPTIVVDYAGDPEAKTNSRFEGILRDLVGTVWIDEKDRTLVQVEGHFLKDFKVGFGLIADVRKDSSFHGKWSKVNEEAWLPVEFGGQGKIRILLVTGFDGSMRMVTSDYRKFRTSSVIVRSEPTEPSTAQPQEKP